LTRVLLVDDNAENLEFLGALLTERGFDVESAHDGADALDKAHRLPPDALVSELIMPVMDGYTLLRSWKSDARLKAIPFMIYTSSFTEAEDEELAFDLGADHFMVKPAEPDRFIDTLAAVIGRPCRTAAQSSSPHGDSEMAFLKRYTRVLVGKLQQKSRQLEESNRELLREIFERGKISRTQIAILNALPAHIALIDSQGVILAVNESWRRYGARNGADLAKFGAGQNYLSICDSATGTATEEAGLVAAGIRSVLRGDSASFVLEYPCHSPQHEQWFRVMVTPLNRYEASGAVVMHVDVTDRKGAEKRLQESQQQYLLLLNSTAEGIYGLDMEGVCTFCNPAAARFLGYDAPDEIVGQHVHNQHHHTRRGGQALPLDECRVHGLFPSGEATHTDDEVFFRKDGSHFPVECWSHPIRRGNEIIGAVVAFLDISERRNLEAQFLQSQKMEAIGRLAGGVAHDFNNCLQVILTCSELLADAFDGPEGEREYIREIHYAGQRGASLTRQLLAFSRKQIIRPKPLNLNVVIADMRRMLRRIIGVDIELRIERDSDECAIEADAGQMEQVLMNLAVNARDAMPTGGEFLIGTSIVDIAWPDDQDRRPKEPRRYALLSVRDTGCGMDSMTRSRMFEPFFTTKDSGKGSGLGLSTVYGIVKQAGGFVEVDSEPNQGTTFRIYIPALVDSGPPAVEATSNEQRRGGSESILLVEDEESLLTLMTSTLRAHGYTVFAASNGREALRLAVETGVQVDLLVTDVILPDMSGARVAEKARESHRNIRVVFISGFTDDHISSSAVVDGRTLLLEKPFSITSLLTKIRDALEAIPRE
jgi:PAS domain S-box-containing protein